MKTLQTTLARALAACVCLAGLCLFASGSFAAGPTGWLNDTGQVECVNDVAPVAMVTCAAALAGDAGTLPRQDGRFGRDVAAPVKIGGGVAGFDFTRMCWSGAVEGSATCTGTLVANTTAVKSAAAATDWACTKDNVTNLIWSLQTQRSSWTLASATTYANAGHNTPKRCGFSTGWRLPTSAELLSIVHNGLAVGPMVDILFFPSMSSSWYWSSESDVSATDKPNAWVVYFGDGESNSDVKSKANSVLLVRSGP